MIVCICHAVNDKTIRKAVRHGACSMRALRQELNVASQCGKCACMAHSILREETSQSSIQEHSAQAA